MKTMMMKFPAELAPLMLILAVATASWAGKKEPVTFPLYTSTVRAS